MTNRWKPWWDRVSVDVALFVLIVLCLIGLVIMAALIPLKAHSAACLTIDVPPGAVIGQPDGDTFHVFAFQPGGKVKIRVQGIDAPERGETHWAEAKAFTQNWLAKGWFQVMTCGQPTLDRIVGKVERNGESLAEALTVAGYGRP